MIVHDKEVILFPNLLHISLVSFTKPPSGTAVGHGADPVHKQLVKWHYGIILL